MNLYLLEQTVNNGYDTYDSAVVAAENEDIARKTSVDGFRQWSDEKNAWMFCYADGTNEQELSHPSWTNPENVKVTKIGVAADDIKEGIIIGSFNAG